MRKLAGWVVGGLVTIAGLYLSGVYLIGQESAKKYHQFLDQATNEYQLPIRNDRFKTGLFESTAHSVIDLSALDLINKMPPETQRKLRESPDRFINLTHQISHGPLAVANNNVTPALAVIKTTVDWTQEQAAALKTVFADQVPLEITTVMGFAGDSRSHIAIAEIHQNTNAVKIDWSGFQADLLMNHEGNSAEYTFNSPDLFVSNENGVININSLYGNGELTRNDNINWNGDLMFNIDAVEINTINKKNTPVNFNIKTIGIKTSQTIKENLLDIANRVTLEKFTSPEFEVRDVVFDWENNNLDYNVLAELQELESKLKANTNMSIEQRQTQFYMNAFRLASRLLNSSPEIIINEISFKNEHGVAKAKLLAKYQANKNEPVNIADTEALMRHLQAELAINVTEKLTKKIAVATIQKQVGRQMAMQGISRTPQQIETQSEAMIDQQIDLLTAKKILIKQNDQLSTNVKFTNMNFTINGNPANEFFRMFMASAK